MSKKPRGGRTIESNLAGKGGGEASCAAAKMQAQRRSEGMKTEAVRLRVDEEVAVATAAAAVGAVGEVPRVGQTRRAPACRRLAAPPPQYPSSLRRQGHGLAPNRSQVGVQNQRHSRTQHASQRAPRGHNVRRKMR